jgi:molecular chaperone Hsp33
MSFASDFVALDGGDDAVMPFAVESLDVRGRTVRLSDTVNAILSRHMYPAPVARVLGEAMVLTVMLGSALKDTARFQVQTKSDGPIDMIVVDYDAPGTLRAYARFNADKIASASAAGHIKTGELLGHGHLAMTIEQGANSARYQGIVALESDGFEAAAHRYFLQSEQIPTRIRLAVGEAMVSNAEDGSLRSTMRAGGIMVQFLPTSPDRLRQADLHPGDAPEGHTPHAVDEDDAWSTARALVETVEDHELLDPTLGSERLLFRLFHENGARVFPSQPVKDGCTCSQDRILKMLRGFSKQEQRDMVGPDAKIGVTCEFCSRSYTLDPSELEQVSETAND